MGSSGEDWSGKDIALVDFLFPTTPVRKISLLLGRTERAIVCLASRRGIKKKIVEPTKTMSADRQEIWLENLHAGPSAWPAPNTDWVIALRGRRFEDVKLKPSPTTLTRVSRISSGGGFGYSSLASSHSINKSR